MKSELIEKYVACPLCHGNLESTPQNYCCRACGKVYEKKGEQTFFAKPLSRSEGKDSPDAIVFAIKKFLKKYASWVFRIIHNTVTVYVNVRPKHLIRELGADAFIVNIGSGVDSLGSNVINLDLMQQSGVDVIANVYHLPFKSDCIDLVVCESLFEHLEQPELAINEIRRVLKNGGRAYILTPFMLGFHSSPHDYYRWTIPGMNIFLKSFKIVDSGVAIGPTGAFVSLAREWLAMVLSFNIRSLYQLWTIFFMIVFIPLNILDFVIARYSYSSQIALAYYWVAEKE